MKKEFVMCAQKNLNALDSLSKNRVQKIAQIKLDGLIDVYDLEIEDDHCYFANEILVSNSHYADAFTYAMQAVNHIETVSSMKGALEKHKALVDNRRNRI